MKTKLTGDILHHIEVLQNIITNTSKCPNIQVKIIEILDQLFVKLWMVKQNNSGPKGSPGWTTSADVNQECTMN